MTIQQILLQYEPEKKNILPVVKAVNEALGWVSKEAIQKIARYFNESESHIFSVASFYDEINMEKPVELVIEVCDSANCQTKNAEKLIKDAQSFLKVKEGESSSRKFLIKRMSCLGRCLDGPVVRINGVIYTKVTSNRIIELIQNHLGY